MEPSQIGKKTSIQPACFRNVPWVDIALVVSAAVLGIIALLVHLEVINPAFNLPTLSSHLLIKSICTAGAGVLVVAEIGKLIYSRCSTNQVATLPTQGHPTEDPPKEIKIHENTVQHTRYYEKRPESKLTAFPITKSFTLANCQLATLYAICPLPLGPRTEQRLIQFLQVVSTPQEALEVLNRLSKDATYKDLDLAVRIGDSLVVSAHKTILFDGVAGSEATNIRQTYEIQESNTDKMLILASSSTFERFPSKKLEGNSFTERSMGLFTDLQERQAPEICMITLNLNKKTQS